MYRVQKIRLYELSDFLKSDTFSSLEDKPMSSLRVLSYLKNPHAKKEDIVLYMAFENQKLVGYRTIWKDIYYVNEKPETFGWFSGNWVHPKFRRKGISTLLFNEVYKDWNKKLIYTNYALNSKLLYDKTGCFEQIKSLVGTRFYNRFCTVDVLVKKHKTFSNLKIVFMFIDFIANILLDIKNLFSKKAKTFLTVKKDENWNNEINLFLNKFKKNEFFKRDEKTYKWIKDYPWIQTKKEIKLESKRYFFSLYAKDFQSNYYTFYTKENELTAFLWLSIKDGHLKIPYAYYDNEQVNEVINFILTKCQEKKVKTVLVYDSTIESLLHKKMFYVTKKTFYQNFFATKNIGLSIEETKKKAIQSGNGDVIFT